MTNPTFLEKLLDGAEVEWKPLGEVVSIINPPTKVKKEIYHTVGKFPIIDQGASFIAGYTDKNIKCLPIDEYVVFGDHSEHIKYIDFAFIQGADGLKILKSNLNSTKYIYYALKTFYKKELSYKRHWSVAKETIIPIPCPDDPKKSLAIQAEIVRILDKFTSLTTELTTELTARKKQYNYYREKLLTFSDDEVEWKPLGDEKFFEIKNKSRKPVKSSLRVPGKTPYYGANNIQDYVDGYTHNGEYVLIAEDGTKSLEKYSIQYATKKFWANNHVHIVRGKHNVNTKYLYHYLFTVNFIPFLAGGERVKLTKGKMINIQIPIPCPDDPKKSLAIQAEIVRILDKFDTLTNSISEGLPKEIEQRQKQYEYYRKQLFNFPKPESMEQ